jgi:hypothetical protein
VVVAVLLLAAPVIGAVLFWGSWGWVALSVAVAVVELVTFRRSERFSSRVWRSIRVGRRSERERSAETVYVVSAAAGVVLLVIAIVRVI